MQKMIVGSVILLVAQIALTLAVYTGDKNMEAAAPETPFLDFSVDAVRSMQIRDAQGRELLLEKEGQAWLVAAASTVPADVEKIRGTLDKLASLRQGFVVAVSRDATRRFKVDGDEFEKHLVLRGESELLADFYLGTSPAFRQIHARRADSRDIITVSLNSFELESEADKWLDKSLAKFKGDELAGIEFSEFVLKNGDDGWRLDGLAENQEANTGKVNELASKAGNLTARGVIEQETAKPLFEAPAFRFTALRKDGGKTDYLFARENEESWLLKLSDRNFYLKVRAEAVEELRGVTRESLLSQTGETVLESTVSPATE
jgi:hypothetical protein